MFGFMNALLFSEIGLCIWFVWALLALVMGYLIASSMDDPDDAAAAIGSVAIGFGIWEAITGGGFFRGIGEAVQNFIYAALFVPAWPVVYLLEPSWFLGQTLEFGWAGCLFVCGIMSVIGASIFVYLWVLALAYLRRFLPDFIAAATAMVIFLIAPAIAATMA